MTDKKDEVLVDANWVDAVRRSLANLEKTIAPALVYQEIKAMREDLDAIRTHMHDIEHKLKSLECIEYD
jgi:hypothetical protein